METLTSLALLSRSASSRSLSPYSLPRSTGAPRRARMNGRITWAERGRPLPWRGRPLFSLPPWPVVAEGGSSSAAKLELVCLRALDGGRGSSWKQGASPAAGIPMGTEVEGRAHLLIQSWRMARAAMVAADARFGRRLQGSRRILWRGDPVRPVTYGCGTAAVHDGFRGGPPVPSLPRPWSPRLPPRGTRAFVAWRRDTTPLAATRHFAATSLAAGPRPPGVKSRTLPSPAALLGST